MYRIFIFLSFIIFFTAFSCKPSGTTSSTNNKYTDTINPFVIDAIELITPVSNDTCIYGKVISFKSKLTDPGKVPDSIAFLLDGKYIGSIKSAIDSILWSSVNTKLGNRNVEVIAYFTNEVHSFDHHKIFIKLDQKPLQYSYKIVKTYPHDREAYTQGLVYENGLFYEGTGIYKQSTLRKVKLETGEPIKSLGLPENVFGEGIAVFDLLENTHRWFERF